MGELTHGNRLNMHGAIRSYLLVFSNNQSIFISTLTLLVRGLRDCLRVDLDKFKKVIEVEWCIRW